MLTKEYLNDLINHFKESKKYFEEVDGVRVAGGIEYQIYRAVK